MKISRTVKKSFISLFQGSSQPQECRKAYAKHLTDALAPLSLSSPTIPCSPRTPFSLAQPQEKGEYMRVRDRGLERERGVVRERERGTAGPCITKNKPDLQMLGDFLCDSARELFRKHKKSSVSVLDIFVDFSQEQRTPQLSPLSSHWRIQTDQQRKGPFPC